MKKLIVVVLVALLLVTVAVIPAEAKASIPKTDDGVNSGSYSLVLPKKDYSASPTGFQLRIPLPSGYSAVFTTHTGYVSGCINRYVPHVGFLISKAGQSQPVTDIHVAAWRDSGRVCVGIYISPQGWCTKICSPTYSQIVGGIAKALMAAGIAYVAAYAIASVLAPTVVAVLVI